MKKWVVVVLISFLVIGCTSLNASNTSKKIDEITESLDESIDASKESFQNYRIDFLENQIIEIWDDLTQLAKQINKILMTQYNILTTQNVILKNLQQPSYDYLKGVTVFIKGVPIEEPDNVIYKNGFFRSVSTITSELHKTDDSWIGTGVIIKITDKYTYILTNAHVAGQNKGESKIYVEDEIDDYLEVEVIKYDDWYDLALVRLKGFLKNKQAIKGVSFSNHQEKLFMVGHHLGRRYTYGEGTFAGYQRSFDLVQLPTCFGNSGSGIFNQEGKLVGMIFAINKIGYDSYDTTHGLAIPGYAIRYFLKDLLVE